MLDGLLGRGFASKCKSLIKLTKSRIDVLWRKKKATLKFLKKDIADLLANGLDINAFGRAEGLIIELKISYCYDFLEQSCDAVLKHLPIMEKQRECPEECCEAVASLMFAAARFSDLPELRELRQTFHERFGTSLERFENQRFVENLASKPSTLEKKVQLLQDIALEFSIKWDSVAFEKRMSTPTHAQGLSEGFGSSNAVVGKPTSHVKEVDPRGGKDSASYKESFGRANGGHKFLVSSDSSISKRKEHQFQSRQGFPGNGHEKLFDKEEPVMKIDGYTNHFGEKKSSTVCKYEARNGKVDSTFRTERTGSSSSSEIQGDADDGLFVHNGRQMAFSNYLKFSPNSNPALVPSAAVLQLKSEIQEPSSGNNTHTGRNGHVNPPGKAEEEKRHKLKPNYPPPAPTGAGLQLKSDAKEPAAQNTPTGCNGYANLSGNSEDKHHKLKSSYNSTLPPYVKANSRLKDHKDGGHLESSRTENDNNCVSRNPQKHVRSEMMAGVTQLESRHSDHESQITSPTKANSHHEKDHLFGNGLPLDALPKPRSVRRRHHKSRSSRPVDNAEDVEVVRRKSRSKRRDDKRGLQLLVDEEHGHRDEEERIIDKLLIHYSKKPSTFEPGMMRRKHKSHLTHDNSSNAAKSPPSQSRDRPRPDEQSDIVPTPARSVSLPREHVGPSEATKVFTRAVSFQPDRSNAAKHVHPKLPDYDDLAARFAALRGR